MIAYYDTVHLESIQPIFDFIYFPIFAVKLGVCNIRGWFIHNEMDNLYNKNGKKYSF